MPLPTIGALSPATPPSVDVGSGLSSLMDQFKAARLQSVRKDALSGLMQGGGEDQYRSAISKLMAAGDIQGANAVTSYYKAANPQMDPYQSAMIEESKQRRNVDLLKLKAEYPWLNVGGDEGAPGATTVAQDGTTTERPHPMSMADLNADKKYAAGDYQTFLQGGLSETEHNLKSLEHARDLLKSDPSISGPVIGMFVKKAMSGQEDASTIIARKVNPEAFNVAAAHQRAVVASLRPLLGARAAQQLFQSVLASTYDPSANPEDNVRRLDLIIDNIRKGAIAKQKMAEYFSKNQTLSQYPGQKFDLENFDPSEGVTDTSVANKTTPGTPEQPSPEVKGVGENIYREPGKRPSQGDMDQLHKYANDPAFRAEFEGIYGRGSVDRWLGVGEWKPR